MLVHDKLPMSSLSSKFLLFSGFAGLSRSSIIHLQNHVTCGTDTVKANFPTVQARQEGDR